MDLRSPLGKVRGLGSAKSGSHHWWLQRVTALALIPLVIWFVLLVAKASINADKIVDYLQMPFNAVLMVLFLGVALYHGALGLRVVIEDYVSSSCSKNFLLITINFFTVITAVAAIFAVIVVHTGGAGTAGSKGWKKSHHSSAEDLKFKRWKNDFLNRIQKERAKSEK